MLRRSISRRMALPVLGSGVLSLGLQQHARARDVLGDVVRRAAPIIDGRRIPPLYAVAYIDPSREDQQGQEATVAKYPLAIVPQDMRADFVAWRDRVRTINPDIIYLGYQMTIETTTVPGPGHDVLRRVADPTNFIRGADGTPRTFGAKGFQLYDPRSREWQEHFLEACAVAINSYSYHGLFLDQCSIFLSHGMAPALRTELKAALAATLLELRRRHPMALLVANSAFGWPGINGEMHEQQEGDPESELKSNPDHAMPELNLELIGLNSDDIDLPEFRERFVRVLKAGGLFSAARTYQRVPWFELYDDVVEAVRQ